MTSGGGAAGRHKDHKREQDICAHFICQGTRGMDVVTAIMFGVMAIVFEQILVEFARDVQDYFQIRTNIVWKWDD